MVIHDQLIIDSLVIIKKMIDFDRCVASMMDGQNVTFQQVQNFV